MTLPDPSIRDRIGQIYRDEYGRVVASLTRRFGDLDIAEDAAAEALLVALERWVETGVPPNPGAWLTATAGNKAIDRLRRESHRDAKYQAAHMITDDANNSVGSSVDEVGAVEDDRLRLIFTCCHPALAVDARVALTLRLLGGVTVSEIARAYFVPETTMAQRITRAKAKIKQARIPFRVPGPDDVIDRVGVVLSVLYLVFNEGYLSNADGDAIRPELTDEAIRLTRLVHRLLPDDAEVQGLLALMLVTDARREARIASGELVTLDEQDRSRWNQEFIREGRALVAEALQTAQRAGTVPGQYVLTAAIGAVHTASADPRDTDWSRILTLYNLLYTQQPTPIVALNRAVAVAEVDGPQLALKLVEDQPMPKYHAWHAVRADLLRRLGRPAESKAAYAAAIGLSENVAERAYLGRRLGQLG